MARGLRYITVWADMEHGSKPAPCLRGRRGREGKVDQEQSQVSALLNIAPGQARGFEAFQGWNSFLSLHPEALIKHSACLVLPQKPRAFQVSLQFLPPWSPPPSLASCTDFCEISSIKQTMHSFPQPETCS